MSFDPWPHDLGLLEILSASLKDVISSGMMHISLISIRVSD